LSPRALRFSKTGDKKTFYNHNLFGAWSLGQIAFMPTSKKAQIVIYFTKPCNSRVASMFVEKKVSTSALFTFLFDGQLACPNWTSFWTS
jgi:hypothetical protein